MSRSSFSKVYEEIINLEPMEMTFTIEDADLDKLHDVLKDINVMECPWLEVQDKHGNKARYYREPQWIPCSERLPEKEGRYLVTNNRIGAWIVDFDFYDSFNKKWYYNQNVVAWLPTIAPYEERKEQ